MDKIEIPFNKTKNIILLLGSLLFVFLGVYFVYDPAGFKYDPIIIRIIGIISIFFFGLASGFILRSLVSKKYALIISEKGIKDNSNMNPALDILWTDIESYSRLKISSQNIFFLHVRNPEYYINQTSGLKKQIMKTNYKKYGSPICLSANSLSISTKELESLINKGTDNFKEKRS